MTDTSSHSIGSVIEGLSAHEGRICFLGCLVSIARRLGVPLTEDVLLGGAIGQRFRFGRVCHADASTPRTVAATIEINSCDLHLDGDRLARFCLRRGLRMDAWTGDRVDTLATLIARETDAGWPLLLMVNSAHLPHWPHEPRTDNGHYLVCYGWSPSQGKAWVMDAFIPATQHGFYMGELPIDTLLEAANCEGFIGRPYCGAWTFAPASSHDVLTGDAVADTLRESAHEMLDAPVRTLTYGALDVSLHSGVNGIDALLEELDRAGSADGHDPSVLREIFPLISSFGGPVRARAVLGDFLKGTASDLGLRIDPRTVALCATLSQSWKTFSNLVLKSAYGGDAATIARARLRLEDIRRGERDLAETLAALPRS